jgi:hypothetical protein
MIENTLGELTMRSDELGCTLTAVLDEAPRSAVPEGADRSSRSSVIFTITPWTLFLLSSLGGWSAVVAAAHQGTLNAERRAELLAKAADVRAIILRGDADALLNVISVNAGLQCTDDVTPYSVVRRDLHVKSSILYMSLFDATGFAARCADQSPSESPATSDRDFFEHSPDSPVEITSISPAGDAATVRYRSGSAGVRNYTFQWEADEWRLVEGLRVGECSCN